MGDSVKAGDVVAKMGNSGFIVSGGVTYWGGNPPPDGRGSHLHFGIRPYEVKNGFTTYHPWIDPNFIFNPKKMQIKTQKLEQELRIIIQAADMNEWLVICKVLGLNPNQIDEEVVKK